MSAAPPTKVRFRFNMIERSFDRAFAATRPSGLETFLMERARAAYWTAARRAKSDEPFPFRLDFKALARLLSEGEDARGCTLSSLLDTWNRLIAKRIILRDPATGLDRINKEFRGWVDPSSEEARPLLSLALIRDADQVAREPEDAIASTEAVRNFPNSRSEKSGDRSEKSERHSEKSAVSSEKSERATIEERGREFRERERENSPPTPPQGGEERRPSLRSEGEDEELDYRSRWTPEFEAALKRLAGTLTDTNLAARLFTHRYEFVPEFFLLAIWEAGESLRRPGHGLKYPYGWIENKANGWALSDTPPEAPAFVLRGLREEPSAPRLTVSDDEVTPEEIEARRASWAEIKERTGFARRQGITQRPLKARAVGA